MSTNEPQDTNQLVPGAEPVEPSQPVTAMQPVVGPTRTPELTLSDEFREFGRQLAALLRVVRESPRAKEVEAQVNQAMRDMERQVNEAMNRAQAADWKGTLKGAAAVAADETQRALARGLRTVNEQMAKTVQEAEEKNRARTIGGAASGGATGPGAATGEVPITTNEPSPVPETTPPTDFPPPTSSEQS